MNTGLILKINTTLTSIIADRCDPARIKSLLIDLRSFTKTGSKLRDLADFMAHPEGRDKGSAYNNAQRMVTELKSSASLMVSPFANEEELMTELDGILCNLGVDSNRRNALMSKYLEVILSIFVNLQLIPFNTKPGPSQILINSLNGQLRLELSINVNKLGIAKYKGTKNVFISFPLISSTIRAPEYFKSDSGQDIQSGKQPYFEFKLNPHPELVVAGKVPVFN